jgi:hypothetical protein
MPLEADVRRAAGLLLVFLDHAVLGILDLAMKLLGVSLTGSAKVSATASHSSGLGTPRARI